MLTTSVYHRIQCSWTCPYKYFLVEKGGGINQIYDVSLSTRRVIDANPKFSIFLSLTVKIFSMAYLIGVISAEVLRGDSTDCGSKWLNKCPENGIICRSNIANVLAAWQLDVPRRGRENRRRASSKVKLKSNGFYFTAVFFVWPNNNAAFYGITASSHFMLSISPARYCLQWPSVGKYVFARYIKNIKRLMAIMAFAALWKWEVAKHNRLAHCVFSHWYI